MNSSDNIPEVEPEIPSRGAVSVYGQDAMDDFPVLKAFQQYIDAEQVKAQKRMTTLCIFFAIILAAVIGVFVLILMNVSQRNNALNDQIFQMMLKDRDRSTAPVVVQSSVPSSQNDAAMKLMSDNMTMLQKMMQDQQKQMADQQLKFIEQQSKATEAAMNAAASRMVAAVTPPPSAEPAAPSPEQLALEQKNKAEKEKIEKSLALLKAEREKMAKERESLKQQQIELQRRRLYPDLYDANGNLIVKKPEPKKAPAPVVVDDDDDDEEIEALVEASKKLKKNSAATPSPSAPKLSVKPIQKKDGTVRYFDEDEDDDDLNLDEYLDPELPKIPVPVPVQKPAAPVAPVTPVPAPTPVKSAEPAGDGVTSSWVIPLE